MPIALPGPRMTKSVIATNSAAHDEKEMLDAASALVDFPSTLDDSSTLTFPVSTAPSSGSTSSGRPNLPAPFTTTVAADDDHQQRRYGKHKKGPMRHRVPMPNDMNVELRTSVF